MVSIGWYLGGVLQGSWGLLEESRTRPSELDSLLLVLTFLLDLLMDLGKTLPYNFDTGLSVQHT